MSAAWSKIECTCSILLIGILDILYSQKYWWELSLAVEAPYCHCNSNIGGSKFGGSVIIIRDLHMYNICKNEILADFNLAVSGHKG